MPFEEAKNQFEKKTQKAPEKVEGNWEQFKTETKDYFDKKQREVADYIDKAKYQDKEGDKYQYKLQMAKALDDVIDGNEATKQEMAEYKNILNKKSETLKKKFEIESVREPFDNAATTFKYVGIKINPIDNIKTYLSTPKEQRIAPEEMKGMLEKIFVGTEFISNTEIQKELKSKENVLCTMFNFLCRGEKSRAQDMAKPIIENVNFIRLSTETYNKLNIWKLDRSDTVRLMANLVNTGVKKEKVADYLLNGVDKIRKLDPENFNTFITSLSSPNIARFLLTSIVSINEGNQAFVKESVKQSMQFESYVINKRNECTKKMEEAREKGKTSIEDLQKYRKENPNVTLDETTTALERDIAWAGFEMRFYNKEIILAEAKKEMAYLYFGQKGMDPTSAKAKQNIAALFGKETENGVLLKDWANRCGIKQLPPQFSLLTANELQTDLAREEWDEKKAYAANPVIGQSFDNKDMRNARDINLHPTIREFYKTGKVAPECRDVLNKQFNYTINQLRGHLNVYSMNADEDKKYFNEEISKKYKGITDVPAHEVKDVTLRLTGSMSLLKSLHGTCIKMIGVQESRLLVTYSAEEKDLIQKDIKGLKEEAMRYALQLNATAGFLGMKGDKTMLNIDGQILSPMAMPLVQKELRPYMDSINKQYADVSEAARPVEAIGKNIQKRQKENARLVMHEFDKGVEQLDDLSSAMKSARNNLLKTKGDLTKSLEDIDKTQKYPDSIKQLMKQQLQELIKQLTNLLTDPKSPFSETAIQNVITARLKLIDKRDTVAKHGMYAGIATAFIFCAAIATAVAGGWALGALAGKIATGGTLASSVFIGGSSMVGVAAGGVVGARGAMTALHALDMADYGGYGKIWEKKAMAKDFAWGFALSIAAVGAAKTLVKTLSWAGKQEGYVAFRLPGLSKFSRGALKKLDGVSRAASPSTWYKGGEAAGSSARETLLKRFGAQTREELYQESMEEAAGKINKTAEFLVSVASATKGKGKLSMHGLKGAKVGITTEGDTMVYTTKTPQEFAAQFKKENLGTQGVDYNMKINADNSVTIELMGGKIDPKTGVSQIYSVIDVKPSMDSRNMTADVEYARVRGLTAVEGKPGIYTVQNSETALDVLGEFYTRGFNLVKTESGNIRVNKGDVSIEIKAPADVMAQLNLKTDAEINEAAKSRSALKYLKDNAVKIKEYFSNIQIKKSFEEFVNKWQGNYARFLENNPRLAQVMPGEIKQLALVDGSVIAIATGVTLEVRKRSDEPTLPIKGKAVEKQSDRFNEPTKPLKGKGTLGTLATLEGAPNKSIKPAKATPERTPEATPTKPNKAVKAMPEGTPAAKVEKVKLDELSSKLQAIGLHDLAKVIADPVIDTLPDNGNDIRTFEQRQKEVDRLIKLDEQIKFETDFLRDGGLDKEANELENYGDSSKYQTLDKRLEVAQQLSQGLEELSKNGIAFTPENAADIIGFLNGKSPEGAGFQKLLIERIIAGFEKNKPMQEMSDRSIDAILKYKFGKIKPELQAKILNSIKQKLIKPEDRAVMEANKENLTPELIDALVVGGENFSAGGKTLRVYKGMQLGEGGLGIVHDVWFITKPSNKLENGVVKIPRPNANARAYFEYESEASGNLSEVLANDRSPASNNVIKPIFATSEIIIYEKVTDEKGATNDLQSTIKTISIKEWLLQFAGGVEGLDYLHKNGITHNDFKPANIVIGKNGGVVIDIGSFINEKNVGSKITVQDFGPPHGKLAMFLTTNGSMGGVASTPTFHDPSLLTHSIENKKPLDLGDKYAVGTSLLYMLSAKGFVNKPSGESHTYNLKDGAPDEAVKLYNLANQLINCRKHPYEYKDNNPKKGKDPGYMSLKDVIRQIKKISSAL